jgi:hypothetical protein
MSTYIRPIPRLIQGSRLSHAKETNLAHGNLSTLIRPRSQTRCLSSGPFQARIWILRCLSRHSPPPSANKPTPVHVQNERRNRSPHFRLLIHTCMSLYLSHLPHHCSSICPAPTPRKRPQYQFRTSFGDWLGVLCRLPQLHIHSFCMHCSSMPHRTVMPPPPAVFGQTQG